MIGAVIVLGAVVIAQLLAILALVYLLLYMNKRGSTMTTMPSKEKTKFVYGGAPFGQRPIKKESE